MSENPQSESRFVSFWQKMQAEQADIPVRNDVAEYVKQTDKGWKLTKEGRAMASRITLRALPSDYSGSIEDIRRISEVKLTELKRYYEGEQVNESEKVFWQTAERTVRTRLRKAERLVAMDRMADRNQPLGQVMDRAVKELRGEASILKQMTEYAQTVDESCEGREIVGVERNQIRQSCDEYLARVMDEYLTSRDLTTTESKREIRKNLVTSAISWYEYRHQEETPAEVIGSLVGRAQRHELQSKEEPLISKKETEATGWQKLANVFKDRIRVPDFLRNRETVGALACVALAGVAYFNGDKINEYADGLWKLMTRQPESRVAHIVPTAESTSIPTKPATESRNFMVKPPATEVAKTATPVRTPVTRTFGFESEWADKSPVFPEAGVIKPDFGVTTSTGFIDLGKTMTVHWPDKMASALGMVNMPFVTDAMSATTLEENLTLASDFDGTWKARPDLTGVVRTTWPGRYVMWCHSGSPNAVPAEMNENWLARWTQAYPDGDPDKKQKINMGCELPRQAGKAMMGERVFLEQDGVVSEWKVTDVRTVKNSKLLAAMGTTEGSDVMDFALDIASVPEDVAFSDGITFVMCDDLDPDTKVFKSRTLISVEIVPPIYDYSDYPETPEKQNVTSMAGEVNAFQAETENMYIGDYLKNSQWYQELPEAVKQKLNPVLESIVNPQTFNFPEAEQKGIQCLGWAAMRVAEMFGVTDPRYIGGDDVEGPTGVVPNEVKQKALSEQTEVFENGRREFWTGKIDYTKLAVGDVILLWENEAPGHTVIIEGKVVVNGNVVLLTSEANNLDYPGQVMLSTISSQDEFNDGFGVNRAVLTKNTVDGQER